WASSARHPRARRQMSRQHVTSHYLLRVPGLFVATAQRERGLQFRRKLGAGGRGHGEEPQPDSCGCAATRPRRPGLGGGEGRRWRSRWVPWRGPWWIPSRGIPSRRRPSLRLLLRPRIRRRGLRRLSVRVPVLWLWLSVLSLRLSLRVLLPRPGLRAGSGLPAADAGLCGSLNPTRSLLPKRLLPPARRWGDGSLFLGMGASCAGSAPGALTTAG